MVERGNEEIWFFAYCCSVIDTDVDRVVQWSGKALRLMGSVFGDYRSMCPIYFAVVCIWLHSLSSGWPGTEDKVQWSSFGKTMAGWLDWTGPEKLFRKLISTENEVRRLERGNFHRINFLWWYEHYIPWRRRTITFKVDFCRIWWYLDEYFDYGWSLKS